MRIQDAMNVLRLDNDDAETQEIVKSLLNAAPAYIEQATGMPEDNQDDYPICDTVTGFLLRLWYYPENADAERLQRVIDNLLKAITVIARK